MEKIYVKDAAIRIIRHIKAEKNIASHASIDLLDILADVVDAVEVEPQTRRSHADDVEAELQTRRSLGGFIARSISGITKKLSPENHEDTEQEPSYILDEKLMTSAASKAATILSGLEAETEQRISCLTEQNAQFSRHLEELQTANTRLRASVDIMRKNTATRLQKILSLTGKSKYGLAREIYPLLEDMGIRVVWSDDDPDPDHGMFSTLTVENLANYREIPCLVHNGEILTQGTIFVAAADEPDSSSDAAERTEIL